MKKMFLSLLVIAGFGIYVLALRRSGSTSVGTVSAPGLNGSSNTNSSIPSSVPASGYKNGTYTGSVADAFYGNVQVQVTIAGGKITDVKFLDYPQDRNTSRQINSQAMPYLTQEAIQAQSANVDIVSGATATSGAFQQSLSSALQQAS
ncbi:MAG TPA: FMN-binding protein [Candidatus Saccharimonadales bacterium]|nr:FMN-binding protein [Candidatus Saccharimonadales bacterium]